MSAAAPAKMVGGKYKFIKTLGAGSFGKVKKAVNINTKEVFAVKIIEKKRLNKSAKEKIHREIKILKMLKHPFIVRLYETIDTPEDIYLIMEYVVGGELFDYIVAHQKVKEKEAKRFFGQICLGVQYCHSKNIIHRDLKPENLMLDADHCIKIIDFGLSNMLDPHKFLQSKCGSPHYTAPEVTEKLTYGALADVFSLGVILFALLCGYLPFDHPNHEVIARDIKAENYEIPSHVSKSAASLIKAMIKADFRKRVSLNSVLRHPWLELDKIKVPELQPDPESVKDMNQLPPPEQITSNSPTSKRKFGFSPLPKSLVAAISKVIHTDKDKDKEKTPKIEKIPVKEEPESVKQTDPADRRRVRSSTLANSVPPIRPPPSMTPKAESTRALREATSSVPSLPEVGAESPNPSSSSSSSLDYPIDSAQAQAMLMDKRAQIAGSPLRGGSHDRKSTPLIQNLPLIKSAARGSESALGVIPYGRTRRNTMEAKDEESRPTRGQGRSIAAQAVLGEGSRRQSMAFLPKHDTSPDVKTKRPTPKSKRLMELREHEGYSASESSLDKPVERRASMAVTEWAMAEKMMNKAKGRDTSANVNTHESSGAGKTVLINNSQEQDENETAEYHSRGGAFNRSATSSKSPAMIVEEMCRVLNKRGIPNKRKTDWRFKCKYTSNPKAAALGVNPDLKFELEVFKLPRLPLHVVLYRRVQGSTWVHKDLCRSILDDLQL